MGIAGAMLLLVENIPTNLPAKPEHQWCYISDDIEFDGTEHPYQPESGVKMVF
jgi:hypothetical protein